MTHENFPHAVFSIHGRTITSGMLKTAQANNVKLATHANWAYLFVHCSCWPRFSLIVPGID